MTKKRFVEFYLSQTLKAATNGFVVRLAYDYQQETGRESVLIYTEAGPQKVTVTGNDLLAIIYDVVEALDFPERERERERNAPLPGQIFLEGCEP